MNGRLERVGCVRAKGTIGSALPSLSGRKRGGLLFLLGAIGLFTFSFQARAEGFRCVGVKGDIEATVYHEVQPKRGTRNVAALIVEDPRATPGHQTVLRFLAGKGRLRNQSAFYEAEMSPEAVTESSDSKEILGLALSELDRVRLAVQFTYGMPLKNGQKTRGQLTLMARSGEVIDRELVCHRYLKH